MNFLLSVILIFCSCFHAFSQSALLDSYTQSELDELKQVNIADYELLSYAIENALEFGEYFDSKHSNLEHVNNDISPEIVSFTDFGFKIKNQNQYYVWENQQKIIIVKSFWVLRNEQKTKR
jgi:hypothetical protein